MPATVKYNEAMKQLHAYIPESMHQKLTRRARKNHRAVTSEVVAIVEEVLRRDEEPTQ
jgi:Arc-like DNA binding domain